MGLFSPRRYGARVNFTVVAVLMMGTGLVLTFMSLRSINYKQTEGTIIESHTTGSGKSRRTVVRYAYAINGINYDNDTVSYSLQMFRNKTALHATYPVGKRVPVYYSITDPAYSVLEKGFSGQSFLVMIGGVVLFVGMRVFRH